MLTLLDLLLAAGDLHGSFSTVSAQTVVNLFCDVTGLHVLGRVMFVAFDC